MKRFDRFLNNDYAQTNKDVVFMKKQVLGYEKDIKNVNFYVTSIMPIKQFVAINDAFHSILSNQEEL